MIIPITLKPPSGDGRKLPPQLANLGNGDLVLIELQGTLEVQGSTDSQFVGTLEIDPKTVCTLAAITKSRTLTRAHFAFQNKLSLVIGPHFLEGKIVSLPAPLAIMEKKKSSPDDQISGMDADDEKSREEVEWQISAVVRKKVIFVKRPMPLLNRPVSKIGKE